MPTKKADLILGTAKLGMPKYGFSSSTYPSDPVLFLSQAAALGITRLDTSPRYGDAEKMIGQYHSKNKNRFTVSTKVDQLIAGSDNSPIIRKSVARSLDLMAISKIDILYLHQNELAILQDPGIQQELVSLKKDGKVARIGASIYSPTELQYATTCGVYDVVQLPVSVLDSTFLELMEKAPTHVHFIARSIYLQGILLNPELLKSQIEQAPAILAHIQKIQSLGQQVGLKISTVATAWVSQISRLEGMILGTTDQTHLAHTIEDAKTVISSALMDEIRSLSSSPRDWTNPRNWKRISP